MMPGVFVLFLALLPQALRLESSPLPSGLSLSSSFLLTPCLSACLSLTSTYSGTKAQTYFYVAFGAHQSRPLIPLPPGSLLRSLLPGVALVPGPLAEHCLSVISTL